VTDGHEPGARRASVYDRGYPFVCRDWRSVTPWNIHAPAERWRAPPDPMSRGPMGPGGVRGAPKPVQLYADGHRPLTGGPREPAVAVIQIFPRIIEGEVCGDHEDVGVTR
jgi:hypothetical protein